MATIDRRQAAGFVVLLGLVSLLADMTYESARSINGSFLASLGARAAVVGFVAGLGELLGYALRYFSGRMADHTGRYWSLVGAGYCLNLLAVPALALAGAWPLAVMLMFLERTGKALRSPARDAMLSYAGHQLGRGWGFALHEAMDQIGAILGPLSIAGLLYMRLSYSSCYAVTLIPAAMALLVLGLARFRFPQPRQLESKTPLFGTTGHMRAFWWYLVGAALLAAGFVDYPLVAFYFEKAGKIGVQWIPFFYSLAMAADALSALLLGKWFDRVGMKSLILAVLLSAPAVPLLFAGPFAAQLIGVLLWGIGMGAQESIMKAAVAEFSSPDRRATAFGVYHLFFGVAWFAGSTLMGVLYDFSLTGLIGFSLLLQLSAIPVFYKVGVIAKTPPLKPS